MKRLEFTCEGCDLTRYVKLPPGARRCDIGRLGRASSRHAGEGAVIFENAADLCPACAEKMRHAINRRTGRARLHGEIAPKKSIA